MSRASLVAGEDELLMYSHLLNHLLLTKLFQSPHFEAAFHGWNLLQVAIKCLPVCATKGNDFLALARHLKE